MNSDARTATAAHTPGPWRISSVRTRESGEPVLQICADGKCYAMVFYSDKTPAQHAASYADARLIAAAPDMLAALTALLERHWQLVMCGDCGNWDVETEKEVIAARAAIAKATGSQSSTEGTFPRKCESCGKNPADPPSRICVGCEAYQEHQR